MAGRKWRSRSRLAQVDLYTRGTLYSFAWLAPACTLLLLTTLPVRTSGAPLTLVLLVAALAVVQVVSGTGLMRGGLDQYLKTGTVTRRQVVTGAALLAGMVGWVLALASVGGIEGSGVIASLLASVAIPFLGAHVLMVPVRTAMAAQVAIAVVAGAGLAAIGSGILTAVGASLVMLVIVGWVAFTVRCSAWVLAVMWELDAARGVQARLAVAEERLRFGRDMHDVLGRNLAVIALKSELAVQLAHRGSAAAVDQMTEVQRLAQDSQREVRDVVRGYREADLHTEFVGARSVLRAAGVDCRIDDGGERDGAADSAPGGAVLPGAVQSALAWVVREGTTNVLRHSEARHCTVRLRVGDAAVLVMENDGVRGTGGSEPTTGSGERGGAPGGGGGSEGEPGSGLRGLQERLAAVGGTVGIETLSGGVFRLTAEVPLVNGESPADSSARLSGGSSAGLSEAVVGTEGGER
ncbi:sensor histidine kinase [Streptomyces sp. XD-27]|uniref:sensor histidine kinase n=1 Tax=Streptomyces sp. XD-27 TaxID=3062779 RepID=UPI0026F44FCB|nr:histidine kinase [Streptomyces sp. XD-27]WKX71224.1 histidine kinase [Streptomyces sp. XD-27]